MLTVSDVHSMQSQESSPQWAQTVTSATPVLVCQALGAMVSAVICDVEREGLLILWSFRWKPCLVP